MKTLALGFACVLSVHLSAELVDAMYVGNRNSHSISVIDAQTGDLLTTISMPQSATPRALAGGGTAGMYVTSDLGVYVIDPSTLSFSSVVGGFVNPWDLALNGGTGLFVVDRGLSAAHVVDTTKNMAVNLVSLPVFGELGSVVWNGGTGMYIVDKDVTSFSKSLLYVISLPSLDVTPGPTADFGYDLLAWDGATGVYWSSQFSKNVAIVDIDTLVV